MQERFAREVRVSRGIGKVSDKLTGRLTGKLRPVLR